MPEHCPIPNELHAYTLGKLPLQRCEEIDVHLVDCQPCQAELETFTGGDSTFLAHLKANDSSDEFPEEAECANVLARVAEFGQEASFNTQHQHAEQSAATAQLGNIGPYQLLAKLGEGGMGTVYKALHPMLKRVVALKMLPVDRMQDEQAIQRFQREMEAVGKLDHPNIVRATDAGDHDGKHFLVMEYVDGIDLSALSKRVGPLPVADACELIRQAAIGLQHAHENGLVHRDIKPSNLMLMDGAKVGGRGASAISSPRDPQSSALVKILDLGLALLPDQLGEESELTSTGQAMGTLDYMSPEQGGDSHDVDIRADIYALGATLYRLLTGQPIYSGPKYKTVMDKWRALATEDPAPLQSRRPDVPDALAAVVHRMLAREVADRYATPQEVAQALAPFCEAANLPALVEARRPPVDDEVSQSTTSLLKEAGSLDTSLIPQDSADLARTQPLVAAGSPGNAKAKPQAATRRLDSNRSLIARGVGLLSIIALASALVFYFQTPHGTLRIEIDDPDIAVKVKGQDVVLTNADKEPIKLKAGEHTLIVTRGDFTFETKQFTLKNGKTTTVKVELLPGQVQVVSAGNVIGSGLIDLEDSSPPSDGGANFALEFGGQAKRSHVLVAIDGMEHSNPFTIEGFVDCGAFELKSKKYVIPTSVWWWGEEPAINLDAISVPGATQWRLDAHRQKKGRVARLRQSGIPSGKHHIAVVWSETGDCQMYIDGVLQQTEDAYFPFESDNAAAEFVIGAGRTDFSGGSNKPMARFFDGHIDELRISSVARYDKSFTPPTPDSRFTPDEHTLALYHFDEGSGDVLHDSSGNGHHGKIVGAKWVRVDGGEIAPETARATDATIAWTGEPILAEPVQYDATEALNRHGLVPYPAPLAGVKSWSLETTVSRGAPRHLAFSPDGEYLAYFADGALRIVGGETYEPVRTIMRPRMREIAWLADSQTISLSEQNEDDTSTVRLWNVRDGHLVRRIDFPFSVGTAISVHHTHPSMAWSGDDRLAIRDADGKVVIYDLATEKVVGELPHLWRIGGVAWSPDDKRLAVTSFDRESPVACIWDTSKFEMLHKLDARDADDTNVDNQPYGMVWSSDSKQLIVGYRLAGVIAWDAETGERKASPSIAFPSTVWKLQRGGQTDEIVIAGGGIETWNLRTGEVRQLHDADGIGAVVSHPRSGRILWTSEFSRGIYSAISLDGSGYTSSVCSLPRRKRRIPPVRPMFLTENLTRPVSRLGESQYSSRLWDGGQAVAATANVAVRMSGSGFEIKRDGRIVWRYIPDDPAEANPWARFALAPDGGTVAQFNRRQLKAWKLPEGELLADIPAPDLTYSNERLFVSADRRFILVDPGGQIAVSGPDFGGDFSVHSIHSGNSVDMSPNGTQLAFYGRLGVTLFDIKSQKMSKPLKAPSSFDYGHCDTVAWRNEKTLALYTIDKQVALFDIPTAKVVRSYPFPWAQRPFFSTYSSFFGAAGQYFIAARWGEDARFIDTTNGWVESIVRYEGGEYLHVGATGHYDASVNIESNLIYVVELPDGSQLNLTPAEFEKRFGWKNDPEQVQFQAAETPAVGLAPPTEDGLTSRSPLHVDEFDEKSFSLSVNDTGLIREIRDGQHVVTCPIDAPKRGHWSFPIEVCDDGILDVTGRVVSGRVQPVKERDGAPTGWIVCINRKGDEPGVTFSVSERRIDVYASMFDQRSGAGPRNRQL